MADFEKSHKILEQIEGGYVNDPLDLGGETLNGISRKHHPDLKMWEYVDKLKFQNKSIGDLKAALKENKDLEKEIKAFYKSNYWDKMRLDEVTSQVIADNMYMFGVNAGIKRAVIFAQKVCDITADGIVGRLTLAALNHHGLTPENEQAWKKEYDDYERIHYNSIVKKNPKQIRFLKGWLKRADLV